MVSLAAKGTKERWCPEYREFKSLAFKVNCNGTVGAVGAFGNEESFSISFRFDVLVEMECTVQLPRVGVLNYVASAL